jgi:hypothetical protein
VVTVCDHLRKDTHLLNIGSHQEIAIASPAEALRRIAV